MDELLRLIEIIAGLLGPIAVAWLTWHMNKSQKENARIKELEQKEHNREREELHKRIDGLEEKIDKVNDGLSGVSTSVSTLQRVDEKFDDEMRLLMKQHQLSGRYTHELAQLVIVLAAGMRDQHLDGNITRAIETYQRFEHETLSTMLNTAPTDD